MPGIIFKYVFTKVYRVRQITAGIHTEAEVVAEVEDIVGEVVVVVVAEVVVVLVEVAVVVVLVEEDHLLKAPNLHLLKVPDTSSNWKISLEDCTTRLMVIIFP